MKHYLKLTSIGLIICLLVLVLYPLSQNDTNKTTKIRVAMPHSTNEKILLYVQGFYKKIMPIKAFASALPDYVVSGMADDEIQGALNSKTDNLLVTIDSDNYTIDTMITISGDNKGIEMWGANITLANGANTNMIKITRPSRGEFIHGGVLDGNRNNQVGNFDIVATNGGSNVAYNFEIIGTAIYNASGWGMNIESPYDAVAERLHFNNNATGDIRWHAGNGSVIRSSNFDTLPVTANIAIDQWGHLVEGDVFRNDNSNVNTPHILLFSNASGPDGVKATRMINNVVDGQYPTVAGERFVSIDFGIYSANSTGITFMGNAVKDVQYGIYDPNNYMTNAVIIGQTFTNVATPITVNMTANIVSHNQGFVTENSGSSVGTGVQQTIAHGLGFTPRKQDIGLFSDNGTASIILGQTANPDATNIYVTATANSAYHWGTIGR